MKEPLTIYPNRRQFAWALVGSVVFVTAAGYILATDDPGIITMIVLWVAVLFFGFGIFVCGLMILRKQRPMLTLDRENLTVFSGNGTPHAIAWSRIAGFREERLHGQHFILIDITDPEQVVAAEQGAVRRKLMEFNLQRYGAPYNLAPGTLNYPKGQLTEMLREFHEKYHRP